MLVNWSRINKSDVSSHHWLEVLFFWSRPWCFVSFVVPYTSVLDCSMPAPRTSVILSAVFCFIWLLVSISLRNNLLFPIYGSFSLHIFSSTGYVIRHYTPCCVGPMGAHLMRSISTASCSMKFLTCTIINTCTFFVLQLITLAHYYYLFLIWQSTW